MMSQMTTRVSAAWTIATAALACTRADYVAPWKDDAAAVKPSTSASSPPISPPTTRPDAPVRTAPVVPPAGSKRLRLEGVGDADPERSGRPGRSLEITVPARFVLEMHGRDARPSAHLEGGGLALVVEARKTGFATLTEAEATVSAADPKATFIRADETRDGYVLVYREAVPGTGPRFGVVVSQPRLRVDCSARSLAHLSDAERVASICLTLRAAANAPGI